MNKNVCVCDYYKVYLYRIIYLCLSDNILPEASLMAKTFTRDGVEYRRFTMDIPEPLYQLMEATWGRYGKSEKISNILIGVLTGVNHYDVELAALQSRYDEIATAQASLLEMRIREKEEVALGIEKVQQILYSQQQAVEQADATQETIALESVQGEASEFLDREFRVDNFDIDAPTDHYWVKYYTDRVNQHLAHIGATARVDDEWIEAELNRRKSARIATADRFDDEIPDDEIPDLVVILQRMYDRSPDEHQRIEALYRRIAGDDLRVRAAVDDYLLIRSAELGVMVG